MKEIQTGEKKKGECASELDEQKSNRLTVIKRYVDTDTSIRIMNKPKRSACSRDVTNINNVFALYNGREISARVRKESPTYYYIFL